MLHPQLWSLVEDERAESGWHYTRDAEGTWPLLFLWFRVRGIARLGTFASELSGLIMGPG